MPAETEEEVLARLEREAMEEYVPPTEEDEEAALDANENSEDYASSKGRDNLPSLTPLSYAESRGYGAEGPHRLFIPVFEPTGEKDEDGFPDYAMRIIKRRIGPYTIGNQIDATEWLGQIDQSTMFACLAWSAQQGEGELSYEAARSFFDALQGPRTVTLGDGQEITRPMMSEAEIVSVFHANMSTMGHDTIEGLQHAVAICLRQFDPEKSLEETVAWVAEKCDYGLLVRAVGKILWLNGGLRQRFLTS